MSKNFYSITDLEDSQILLEKEPPQFIKWLLLIIIITLILVGIWLAIGKKDVAIQGIAVVDISEELGDVKSEIQGKIIEVTKKNNDSIKKGETILILDNSTLDIDNKQINEDLLKLKNDQKMLEELRNSIEQHQKIFSDDTKKSYIYEFNNYIQSYEIIGMGNKLEIENISINGPTNHQIKSLENERKMISERITSLNENNSTSPKSEYAKSQISELKLELNRLNNSIDLAKTGYNNEKVKIEEIVNNQKSIGQARITELKNQVLASISQRIEKVLDEIKNKENEINTLNSNIDKKNVKAEISGKLNYSPSVRTGNIIDFNQSLATILPDNSKKKIKVYINAEERNKVKQKKKVKISFGKDNSLKVNGVISSISDFPILNEDGSTSFYEMNILLSHTDNLEYGMRGKATIITGTESLWNFIIRKLNF